MHATPYPKIFKNNWNSCTGVLEDLNDDDGHNDDDNDGGGGDDNDNDGGDDNDDNKNDDDNEKTTVWGDTIQTSAHK